ncbi:MAG: hypothetical protein NTW60_02325, partial [Candidatus Wolfebacteria bacterium]|nr:hypothetical protein [Candidatus Wolfebacteria bacterium]
MYALVREIPLELRKILEEKVIAPGNNDSYLMDLLLQNPVEVTAGIFIRQEGSIRLPKKISWLCMVREGTLKTRKRIETQEVSEISMRAAVMRLQKHLERLKTHYKVWAECKDGNLRVKKKGSDFFPKESAPFLIGLVDIRFPIREGGDP